MDFSFRLATRHFLDDLAEIHSVSVVAKESVDKLPAADLLHFLPFRKLLLAVVAPHGYTFD